MAAPDGAKAVIATSLTLRISTVTVGFPEPFEKDKAFLKNSGTPRFAEIAPSSLIQWAEVTLYKATERCEDAGGWTKRLKDWFAKAEWGGVGTTEPAGLAPAFILVIPDEEDDSVFWILHLWEMSAILHIGHACADGHYQIRPDTKQAQVNDKALVEAIVTAYQKTVKHSKSK